MTARGRVALVVAVLLVALMAGISVAYLAGRGSGSPEELPPDAVDVAPRAPLTGVAVDDETALDHPAVAIKVSDVREAHPQVGVDRADIVFVEPVGVAYTRLAAVFHSDLPETVGPVRSVRPMDAPLLGPMSPVFANTMGAEWVLEYVDAVGRLDDLGTLRVSGSSAYVQDDERRPPDHVFAKPEVLLGLSDFDAPPAPYFNHAPDMASSSAVLAGGAGKSVGISYGPSWDVAWTYDDTTGRYLREQPWGPHVTADGNQVGAVNVLILAAESVTEKIGDGSGAPVPVLQLVDRTGSFTAFTGGRSVRGTWSKVGVNEPFQLLTEDGDELLLAPGTTWVELPSPEAGVSGPTQR